MVDTPLACDRKTGTIYINPYLYTKLTPFQKKFWLLHEKGHLVLDTSDEIAADNYAFDKLAGTEYRSLKNMIEAAEGLLNSGTEYHQLRIENLYQRAIKWDKEHPQLNKGISNKAIDKLFTGINNLITTQGTIQVKQTETTASATQSTSNSMYIMIVAIVMVLVLMQTLK